MTYPNFNEATWIERLAAALEQMAVGARPSYSPPPPAIPGLRPIGDDAGLPDMRIAYCFPGEYQVDFERWFDDSKLLVDLLSIAKQVPLLSHTRYVRLAGWLEEIEPNLAFGTQSSRGFVSDMWPPGQHLSQGDVDAFLELARGWHRYPDNPDAINLAIRRLAGSLSRPGGRFGQEDRILDIAIAFEVFYRGKTGHNLAQRAAALLGGTAAEQKRTYDLSKGFYDVRSGIVHSKNPPSLDLPDKTLEALEAGRNLACRTLAILFNLDAPLQWADVMKSLLPETQAYIKKAKGQPDK